MHDDDVMYPITNNEDLITIGMSPKDDDVVGEDTDAFVW